MELVTQGKQYLKIIIWILLVFSLILALGTNIGFLVGISLVGFYSVFSYLAYSGQNWAKWVLGILLIIRSVRSLSNLRNSLEFLICLVYGLLGIFLLFSKSITSYIKHKKNETRKNI